MALGINPIDSLIVVFFLLPILAGLIRGLTARTVVNSVVSVFKTFEMIALIFVSVTLIRKALFEETSKIFLWVNPHIPLQMKNIFFERDIYAYIILTPIIFFVLMIIFGLIQMPLLRRFLNYSNKKLNVKISNIPMPAKRIFGGIWNIPKAIFSAIIVGFLLNFYSYFFPSENITQWLNKSYAYKSLYDYTIKPVLHTTVAKDIPLIMSNAFAIDDIINPNIFYPNNTNPSVSIPGTSSIDWRQKDIRLPKRDSNILVIEYFNGVTLDEAVKSNNDIDNFAKKLTADKKTSRDKAKAIYKWISQNISYDKEKARNITSDSKTYTSGAIVAFDTRNGICFDYSCLFIAMCRANKIKVSLVTGIGYNGISWGDHAWNKFFYEEENKWINVDATFGAVDNYFDKKDFYADHKYEKVRAQW